MLRSWCSAWLLLFSLAACADELDEGLAAYRAKDYALAFMRLQPLAQQGVAAAQFTLGEMYAGGEGVKQDAAEATHWYEQAATAGDAKSQMHMGVHYLRSQERDYQQAAAWFKRAAEQDQTEAEYFYARLLLDGKGVEQDRPLAMGWLSKASDRGHAAAQRFLHLLLQADTPDRALALRELERNLAAGVAVLDTVSTDPRYGFDQAHPIKTGLGFEAQWRYLNALRGPQGEVVHYQRLGYCCAFDTDAAESGKGFLDRYTVSYVGRDKPLILYLNMFEDSQPQAPVGFSFAQAPAD
jgi:tetratricopeptide (TPR) repeat protein